MNTDLKNKKHLTRSHRLSIYLNDHEIEELHLITSVWTIPQPQIIRKLLFTKKQVMLDTKSSMEVLDRLGRALEISNKTLSELICKYGNWQPGDEPLLELKEKVLHSVVENKSCIQACSQSILQLIKKI